MKRKNDKRIYLDDYISIAKSDALIRIILGAVIILLMLIIKNI